jgi:NAD(P)-dependent dehydrogenase (short-subunit alcohol dehydrogenase family)
VLEELHAAGRANPGKAALEHFLDKIERAFRDGLKEPRAASKSKRPSFNEPSAEALSEADATESDKAGIELIVGETEAAVDKLSACSLHNGAKAKSVADSLTMEGKLALAVTLDVAGRKQQRQALEKTVERFGHLDVVFNNAGFNSAPLYGRGRGQLPQHHAP